MRPLPEAIVWLEESAKSWTHSSQQVYSRLILDEIRRLSGEVEAHATEIEKREELRKKERTEYLALGKSFEKLKEERAREQDEWDTVRTDLETRLAAEKEKSRLRESLLKDIHYGLLKQPELTRKDLARAIESEVIPYKEGELP